MSNDEPTQKLVDWYLSGTINDNICAKAKAQAETIKIERERQRKEAQEANRLKQIEKQKFMNRFPVDWRYKHVYNQNLVEICTITPLGEMELYANEMIEGKHRAEFKDPDTTLNYLLAQINIRKNALDPLQEKNRLLREAKTERDEMKKQTNEIEQKLEDTKKDLKALESTKPTTQDNQQKAKAYTT